MPAANEPGAATYLYEVSGRRRDVNVLAEALQQRRLQRRGQFHIERVNELDVRFLRES